GHQQAPADPRAQLLRRRLGEGHRQHLADVQALLHHQPQHQRGQGEGLAGPGRGLDRVGPAEREGEVRIAHSPASPSSSTAARPRNAPASTPEYTSPASSAENTAIATSANRTSSSSPAKGSRPRSASWNAAPSPSATPRPAPRHRFAAAAAPFSRLPRSPVAAW